MDDFVQTGVSDEDEAEAEVSLAAIVEEGGDAFTKRGVWTLHVNQSSPRL